MLGFNDLPGLDAGGADQDPPDSALEDYFDALEVGEHAAQRFTDDLGTGTAAQFRRPAAFVLVAGRLGLFTDNAGFRHGVKYNGKRIFVKEFSRWKQPHP